jgi:hypothetical protein
MAGYRARNREQRREYARGYYWRNVEKVRAYQSAWQRAHPGRQYKSADAIARRRESEAIVAAAYSGGCVDCGEKDPLVLTFDHVRGTKKGTVFSYRNSPTMLKAELAKCDVRCANCHLRQTRNRGQLRRRR